MARRHDSAPEPEVVRLDRALEAGEGVYTTGIVLQSDQDFMSLADFTPLKLWQPGSVAMR